MEKENAFARLREIYVEKRLDLLKKSYGEWEKIQSDFLKALEVNKDILQIENEIEKLARMKQGIESRVMQGVGYKPLFNEFVDEAEKKLAQDYLNVFSLIRRYRQDGKKQYDLLKEFAKKRLF